MDKLVLWRGDTCKVLAVGQGPGPRNVLLEHTDGRRVVYTWQAQKARPVDFQAQRLFT